jgi:hypothetical protein
MMRLSRLVLFHSIINTRLYSVMHPVTRASLSVSSILPLSFAVNRVAGPRACVDSVTLQPTTPPCSTDLTSLDKQASRGYTALVGSDTHERGPITLVDGGPDTCCTIGKRQRDKHYSSDCEPEASCGQAANWPSASELVQAAKNLGVDCEFVRNWRRKARSAMTS